ncbi:MAG: hypothetical protein ACTHMS_03585, partial [Jatrophihabitans sp.]
MPSIARSAVLAMSAVAVLLAPLPSAAADTVPQDPAVAGTIGFCDLHDHQVTDGPVDGTPFVWKAVASQPPPKDYLGRGENTILNIFQPRPGVPAGEWSGDQLTAATFYQSSTHPAAIATSQDLPLSAIVAEFPPLVDGLYELRMYFGKTDYGVYSATYPAVFIRVTGDRWNVVNGAPVDCSSGQGQSSEVLAGTVSKQDATRIPDSASVPPPASAESAATGRPSPADGPGSPSPTASSDAGRPRPGAQSSEASTPSLVA